MEEERSIPKGEERREINAPCARVRVLNERNSVSEKEVWSRRRTPYRSQDDVAGRPPFKASWTDLRSPYDLLID
jgi:hypothetical protein